MLAYRCSTGKTPSSNGTSLLSAGISGEWKIYTPGMSTADMNLATFQNDLHFLTQYLKKRFNQARIYLLGHSWGTFLGLLAAQAWPRDYYALLSVGQCVNMVKNEQLMYDFSLSSAKRAQKEKAIQELEWIGRPDDQGVYAPRRRTRLRYR